MYLPGYDKWKQNEPEDPYREEPEEDCPECEGEGYVLDMSVGFVQCEAVAR